MSLKLHEAGPTRSENMPSNFEADVRLPNSLDWEPAHLEAIATPEGEIPKVNIHTFRGENVALSGVMARIGKQESWVSPMPLKVPKSESSTLDDTFTWEEPRLGSIPPLDIR